MTSSVFSIDWPKGAKDYMTAKGYVELDLTTDGQTIPLTFYVPARLAQDATAVTEYGPEYIANLIVVESVTEQQITDAITTLIKRGSLPPKPFHHVTPN